MLCVYDVYLEVAMSLYVFLRVLMTCLHVHCMYGSAYIMYLHTHFICVCEDRRLCLFCVSMPTPGQFHALIQYPDALTATTAKAVSGRGAIYLHFVLYIHVHTHTYMCMYIKE